MLMELAKLAAVQGIMDVFAAKVITSLESNTETCEHYRIIHVKNGRA